MPEAEWRDAWKRYFKVSRLTRQFVVVPSWEPYTPVEGDIAIDLDPGMAFGTGTHASTRLVLEHMQDLLDAGFAPARIADVGCGSGILAIAAVKCWPTATCLAVDNDPIAVQATAENAAHNKVGDRIASELTPITDVTETFPLVLANIQAHVLRALKTALVRATGERLILSGQLTPQAAPLADEFVAEGLKLVEIRLSKDDPQWSSVLLSR
jgi:ribosomal protein L11 methyltransferase